MKNYLIITIMRSYFSNPHVKGIFFGQFPEMYLVYELTHKTFLWKQTSKEIQLNKTCANLFQAFLLLTLNKSMLTWIAI